MAGLLDGKRVAVLAADGVEQVELEQPTAAVRDAGGTVTLLSLESGSIQAMHHDIEPADSFDVDRPVADAVVDDFDALVLPGGAVNPDHLRQDEAAMDFVRDFVGSGKTVAAICHAPWSLVEAGVVDGRRVTSFPSIRTDLRNAGADVVDEEVVIDGNLITSRNPDDLDAFCSALVDAVQGG